MDSPGLIWVRTGRIEAQNPGVLPGAACFCCCVTATVAKNGDLTMWPNFCWVRRTFPDCGWGLHRGVYVPAEKQEIWNWLCQVETGHLCDSFLGGNAQISMCFIS